ncbi:MAG: hypothetical protein M3O50_13445 [Myxococcota bacterium]|nr:hypothetical protein [Myxococcota bacterium]
MNGHSLLVFPASIAFALSACATREGAPTHPPPPASAPTLVASAPTTAPPAPDESSAPTHSAATKQSPAEPTALMARPLALPGAVAPVTLDYIVQEKPGRDSAHERIWIPVGDTGSVDVLDVTDGTFARVDGFKTQQREVRGKTRVMGPSAAAVGDGVVYVGNRATSEVCVVDAKTLKLGMCLRLPTPTDGVAYVSSAKEVWVTTPRDKTLTVLDAAKPEILREKTVIKLDGAPEGYAVDGPRGLFFTNLEDTDRTLAIDVKTHKVLATWKPECEADGPRGIATDTSTGLVFVACTDHVQVLDGRHDGASVSRFETGAGVDNIEWSDARRLLYVAAGKAAMLVVLQIDEKGHATLAARGTTAEGARNAVCDSKGNAYVADPLHARVLQLPLSP